MTCNVLRISAMTLIMCFLLSCNRDDGWDGDLYTTVDHGLAEAEFSSLSNLIDYEGRTNPDVFGKTTGVDGLYCPAAPVTITANGNLTTLTIDFGTGASCQDGRLRTGRLVAVFSGKWKDAGSTVTITPENYTVSNVAGNVTYAVDFDMTIVQNGRDGNDNLNWTTTVSNALFTSPSTGERVAWEAERTTTWVAGEGDNDLTNNEYEITGTANGIARTGRSFTAEVVSPLLVELDCSYVKSGIIEVTPQDLTTRSLDYGPGTCDQTAVLTVGDFVQEINLP